MLRNSPQSTNPMPNIKEHLTVEDQKAEMQRQISQLFNQLTGQERRKVAVLINQSDDTVYRYATDEVKKLPVGTMMRDAMQRVLAER